jgi:hypothetical protein
LPESTLSLEAIIQVRSNSLKTRVSRAAGFILCGLLLTPVLFAQGASDSDHHNFLRRFSVGARGTVFPMAIQTSGITANNPTTASTATYTLAPSTPLFGGGLTVEYAASQRILVSADVLYHEFRYSSDTTTALTAADGTTTISDVAEGTHARYWELPILVHLTSLPARTASAQVMLGVGPTFRYVTGVRSEFTTTNPDGSQAVSYRPRAIQSQTVMGGVASAGVRLTDDFGIKYTPEVRYIRWLSDSFTSWPAQQRRNELHVVVGITW